MHICFITRKINLKLVHEKIFQYVVTLSTYLKWSCNETFKSNESERSEKPIPMNADLPVKS